MVETCNGSAFPFTCTVVKHPTEEDKLLFYNFYGLYDNVYAVMLGDKTFNIPLQVVNSNRTAIEGFGSYDNVTVALDVNYTGKSSTGFSNDEMCTSIWTK